MLNAILYTKIVPTRHYTMGTFKSDGKTYGMNLVLSKKTVADSSLRLNGRPQLRLRKTTCLVMLLCLCLYILYYSQANFSLFFVCLLCVRLLNNNIHTHISAVLDVVVATIFYSWAREPVCRCRIGPRHVKNGQARRRCRLARFAASTTNAFTAIKYM